MKIDLMEDLVADCMPEPCNPIALYWLSRGHWNYWVFSIETIRGIDVTNGEGYEKFIYDLQNSSGREYLISKNTVPKISVGYFNLPTEKVSGMKTLFSATSVKMLVSEKNIRPPVFMDVIIDAGSFELTNSAVGFNNLVFSFSLPKIFTEAR